MNPPTHYPDPEKVKQRVLRMNELCLMFDAQIMVLDELIAQVEAENRNHPLKVHRREKGKQLIQNLMQQQKE